MAVFTLSGSEFLGELTLVKRCSDCLRIPDTPAAKVKVTLFFWQKQIMRGSPLLFMSFCVPGDVHISGALNPKPPVAYLLLRPG